jgi:uncharacterized NAD(P)/FAD-binding protein YdhS
LIPHQYGGAYVDFETGRAITKDGSILTKLFVIGSLTSGVYFFTNALNINTRHAKKCADLIVGEIAEQINDSTLLSA